jgi:hypothetical protein
VYVIRPAICLSKTKSVLLLPVHVRPFCTWTFVVVCEYVLVWTCVMSCQYGIMYHLKRKNPPSRNSTTYHLQAPPLRSVEGRAQRHCLQQLLVQASRAQKHCARCRRPPHYRQRLARVRHQRLYLWPSLQAVLETVPRLSPGRRKTGIIFATSKWPIGRCSY